ncbi:hypothetical protein EJ08DRAFT_136502 [Tothia fuscella]|uniref:Uncharacterized protein n=1 Tax=Tothia fuscella TaxID=1048955 RepID=A0A9P4NTY8_9PEZI|nr:hypothetical protein EJ08DRAFT_136502 [Tothia fuscella]
MDSGSTPISKVTVEYHDPSGVFPLISRQLQSRFPLRDLHWKSPTRPLRSIDFLHVDLTPSRDVAPDTPQSRQGAPVPSQEDALATSTPNESAQQGFFKERRHQIPSLRQTPYVKVFLLRCDDNETYKASSRKALRDWWKAHTPVSQSSSSKNPQENHDAYERLIIHVVLPNTGAAGQTRSSGSSSTSEGATTEKSAKGLLNRSNTIFEKIKADFNVSTKSASERVAQIRLLAEDIPQSLLPTKSTITGVEYEEGPQDRANAWTDLVSKFKSLILSSFNLRVSQYEEDIRERDAQRTLPGWNFCTFFVLKEGLARGFESVGLVDDALIGYDELALGVENAIQEQSGDSSSTRSDSFANYTKELKDILVQCQVESAPEIAAWDSNVKLISATRKGYPEMILGSNISVFDFQCYIFARQMALLLRMGILHSSELASIRQERKISQSETDDLGSLSELCHRAVAFIASICRIMQDDLRHAERELKFVTQAGVIENIVASWAFGVADQILNDTDVKSLPKADLQVHASVSGANEESVDKSFHPARSSSLSHRPKSTNSPSKPEDTALAVFDRIGQKAPTDPAAELVAPIKASDVESLAGHRAELFMLQRQIIERTAELNNWKVGLSGIENLHQDEHTAMKDVDLSEKAESSNATASISAMEEGFVERNRLKGVCQATLMNTTSSINVFRDAFQNLTNLALNHFLVAARINSIERLIADLALIKFDAGDFVAATDYLSRITSSYADRRWGLIETSLLKIHAQCLKKLNRKDDYARMLLSMLGKTAAQQKSHLHLKLRSRFTAQDPWQDYDRVETMGMLPELVSYSDQLPYDVCVPMGKYFTEITVEPHIRHFEDKDGFSLQLKLRHLLDDDLEVNSTRIRLTSTVIGLSRELWLENQDHITLRTGLNSIRVAANITTFHTFTVDKIIIKANKISLEWEAQSIVDLNSPFASLPQPHSASGSLRSPLLCFPRPESFHAELSLSRSLHIDKIRTLEIRCFSGWNDVEKAEIHLRSASAGLRLRTADASLVSTVAKLAKPKTPGVLEILDMPPSNDATLHIPYNLEDDLHEISLRLDISYTTPKGKFEHWSHPTISTELAVDVSVHDFFKASVLFSKFLIKPMGGVPLQVLEVKLEGTDRFSVQTPPCALTPVLVFPSQPAIIMYRIAQKDNSHDKLRAPRQSIVDEKPLMMTIDYGRIDEQAVDAAVTLFREAVVVSQFATISFLLVQTFKDQLRRLLPTTQFVEVAMVNQLRLPEFQDLGWNTLLDSLPKVLAADLLLWLRLWHSNHEIVEVPLHHDKIAYDTKLPTHQIVMNVPLPRLHLLQTVSLTFPKSEPAVFSADNLIPAEINIKHTRRWDSLAAFTSISAPDSALEFVYEIHAPNNTWLIGGQRRTKFSAKEDESMSWTVFMMPQKAGRLLLPTVDVRVIGTGAEEISCETDLRSLGDTIIVVANLETTTVSLSEGVGGGEAVMIGSNQRHLRGTVYNK